VLQAPAARRMDGDLRVSGGLAGAVAVGGGSTGAGSGISYDSRSNLVEACSR
jgi:hypothetical protein